MSACLPQELALSTLMKFVQLEGAHPLEKPKWEGNYLFPRQLFKVGRARGAPGNLGRAGMGPQCRWLRSVMLLPLRHLGEGAGGHGGPPGLPTCPPQSVVQGLLSPEEDRSLLVCHFQEHLRHDDIRYHTMLAATDVVGRVADGHHEVSWAPCLGEGRGGPRPSSRRAFGRCPSLSGTTPSRCCLL